MLRKTPGRDWTHDAESSRTQSRRFVWDRPVGPLRYGSRMDLHGLDLAVSGIAGVLDEKLLVVPPYQRPYSWGADQVEAFWDDLHSALSERSNYFLGSVVLSSAEDHHAIVDGQQR